MTRLERLLGYGLTEQEARELTRHSRRAVAEKLGIAVVDFGAEEKQMAFQLAEGYAREFQLGEGFMRSPLSAKEYVKEMVTSAGLAPGVVDPQHVIHHVKKRRKKRLKSKKKTPYIIGMWPSGFAPVDTGDDGGDGGD